MRISDWSSDVCSSDLVIADQIAQSFVGQFELARLQPMRLDLLRDQMELGDLDLLVLGIAFEPDNLHAVEQGLRSEEHTSELQSLMRISYAVFCLKKKNTDSQ